jgi:hypothetical protein
MSKRSPEEQNNPGIKFSRDENGVVSYVFVNLDEVTADNKQNVKKLVIRGHKVSIEPFELENKP